MLAPNGDLARARAWLAAQSSRLAGPPRAAARERLTAGSGGLPHRPATLRAAQVELWTLLGCRAPLSCLPMGSMGSAPYRLETRPPRFLKVPMVPERPEQDADARRAAGENLQERRALAHLHAHAPGLCPAPVALLPSGTLVAELIDGARPSAGACRTELLPSWVAALARLHAVPVAGAPADGPWVQLLQQPLLQVAAGAARALGADGSDALLALASAAQAQLHGQRAPTVLVHGDCKPGNMVVTRDGRLVLVDLAGLRRGDAALDIAHMCTRIDADGDTCRLAVALYLQHRQEPEGFTPLLARVEAWQMALQVRLLARHAGTDMAELVPLVAGRLAEQMAQASEPGEADAPAGDRLSP